MEPEDLTHGPSKFGGATSPLQHVGKMEHAELAYGPADLAQWPARQNALVAEPGHPCQQWPL